MNVAQALFECQRLSQKAINTVKKMCFTPKCRGIEILWFVCQACFWKCSCRSCLHDNGFEAKVDVS